MKDIKVFVKKRKKKKQQYGCERCKNLSEDEKINWLGMEKNIIEKKRFILINKKVF